MSTPELTLYYDGNCPFCAASMQKLRGWNGAGRLAFVDIAADGFDPAPLGVDMTALNRELHALTAGGILLAGTDSILAAYTLAGQGWRVLLLRVRPLRPLLAALYRKFALHRYRISAMLGYTLEPRCRDGVCRIGKP
ncbi:MAG: DUF393 domain-containing protein [Pseudomonadota bacterium]